MPIALNSNAWAPVSDDLDKRGRENTLDVDQSKATGFNAGATREHYTNLHSCPIL